MYPGFYNFKAEPFRLSPDHRFCYEHKGYARARAYMAYAFMRAEGFVMITGRPGTGKTTLIGELLENLARDNVFSANLVCTQLQADDLLKTVAYQFGIAAGEADKADLLQRLHTLLHQWHREGRRALLVVDEAQDLSPSAMEELRLLTNIQVDGQPLLQIFLLGQPELRELVLSPGMEQVHQRIVAASHLEALEEGEVEAYVVHRLKQVGWQGDPAVGKALFPLLHKFSEGIPRRINLICSRLFLHCAVEQRHQIDLQDLEVVIGELQQENLAAGVRMSPQDFVDPDVAGVSGAAVGESPAGAVGRTVDPGARVAPPRDGESSPAAAVPARSTTDAAGSRTGPGKKKTTAAVTSRPTPAPATETISRSDTVRRPANPGQVAASRPHRAAPRTVDRAPPPPQPAARDAGAPAAADAARSAQPRRNEAPTKPRQSNSGVRAAPADVASRRRVRRHGATAAIAVLLLLGGLSGYFFRTQLSGGLAAWLPPAGFERSPAGAPREAPPAPPVAAPLEAEVDDGAGLDPTTGGLVAGDPGVVGGSVPHAGRDERLPDRARQGVATRAGADAAPDASERSTVQPAGATPEVLQEERVVHQAAPGVERAEPEVDEAAAFAGPRDLTLRVGFPFDSSQLDREARFVLDEVVNMLRREAGSTALVSGFADHIGDAAYNLSLSRERAKAVERYLLEAGIERDRLLVEGRGVPSASSAAVAGHGAIAGENYRIVKIQIDRGGVP